MKIFLLFIIFISTSFSNTLQETINKATAFSTIKLSSGIYNGKIVINKPLTIIGIEDGVIISGNNKGTVISITSSNVVLQNLTITNSGNRLEMLDSGISMSKVKNCKIINCKIINSLYGIDMMMVENSFILSNYITSKNNDISLKGDALKIWYGKNNIIKNNIIEYSRDITLTRSKNTQIINNTFIHNRYGLHISKSSDNLLYNNIYQYNSVGIMLMGAKDTKIQNNQIKSSKGAAGFGIVMKDISNLLLEDNTISYNTQGLYIDSTNKEEGMQRFIINNEISYNKEAIHFHEAIKNNTIVYNQIFGNIDDIVKDVRGIFTSTNIIEYNYWDRYAGFDRDGDNIGDTTHKNFQYADQLWHYNNKIKFFYASPVMTLMNFLSNLAPFIEPIMLLEDTKPVIDIKYKYKTDISKYRYNFNTKIKEKK